MAKLWLPLQHRTCNSHLLQDAYKVTQYFFLQDPSFIQHHPRGGQCVFHKQFITTWFSSWSSTCGPSAPCTGFTEAQLCRWIINFLLDFLWCSLDCPSVSLVLRKCILQRFWPGEEMVLSTTNRDYPFSIPSCICIVKRAWEPIFREHIFRVFSITSTLHSLCFQAISITVFVSMHTMLAFLKTRCKSHTKKKKKNLLYWWCWVAPSS